MFRPSHFFRKRARLHENGQPHTVLSPFCDRNTSSAQSINNQHNSNSNINSSPLTGSEYIGIHSVTGSLFHFSGPPKDTDPSSTMMHHNHNPLQQQHRLPSQDENAFPSASSSSFKSSSQENHKTPLGKKSASKKKQRRAFGDISNKKPAGNSKSFTAGPKTPLNQKPSHISLKPTTGKKKIVAAAPSAAVAPVDASKTVKKSSKSVNFVLPDSAVNPTLHAPKVAPVAQSSTQQDSSISSMDMADLEPVEPIAYKTWTEKQKDTPFWDPEPMDLPTLNMEQVFAKRRQARMEEMDRKDRESEEYNRQKLAEMHLQDGTNERFFW